VSEFPLFNQRIKIFNLNEFSPARITNDNRNNYISNMFPCLYRTSKLTTKTLRSVSADVGGPSEFVTQFTPNSESRTTSPS